MVGYDTVCQLLLLEDISRTQVGSSGAAQQCSGPPAEVIAGQPRTLSPATLGRHWTLAARVQSEQLYAVHTAEIRQLIINVPRMETYR